MDIDDAIPFVPSGAEPQRAATYDHPSPPLTIPPLF